MKSKLIMWLSDKDTKLAQPKILLDDDDALSLDDYSKCIKDTHKCLAVTQPINTHHLLAFENTFIIRQLKAVHHSIHDIRPFHVIS